MDVVETQTAALIKAKNGASLESGKSSAGKEVAIQADSHKIERNSGQLPLRKRFVPLRLNDYCIFGNDVKEEEEEEETRFSRSEETQKAKLVSQGVDTPKRGRGKLRKTKDKAAVDETDLSESNGTNDSQQNTASIQKVSDGFKCGICHRVFSLRGNAKTHLITHTDKKPFQCDFKDCGQGLRTKESFRRHKLGHLGIKSFECFECSKKFSCNLSLQEHMNLHTGEKPYTCDICGMKFRQSAVLKRHKITHSNQKPYSCGICGKAFALKVYIRTHMKSHTGEKPYTCDVCNKSFAHQSDLNRHKIIHSGTKPYKCSVCPMRYSDSSSRRRHEREHQNERQFMCHLCNQKFPRAGQLRSHLVREHATSNVLIESKKDAGNSSVLTTDELTSIDSSHKPVGKDLVNASEVFPRNSTYKYYKVVTTEEGNQVLEVQVAEDSIIPLQELSEEMKLNISEIKLSEGLATILNHRNKVTVLEEVEPAIHTPVDLLNEKSGQTDNLAKDSIGGGSYQIENAPQTQTKVNEPIEENVTLNEALTEQTQRNLEQNEGEGQVVSGLSQIVPYSNSNPDNDNFTPEMTQYSSFNTALNYIDNPDLNSQEYYNWLSVFSEECKELSMPLSKDVFQKISQLQKTLSDFMALPSGVITDKNNFKILMGITQDLSQITAAHLSFMYSQMNN